MTFVPLKITAKLRGPVVFPLGTPCLESILGYAVSKRDGLPPPLDEDCLVKVDVPIKRSDCDQFYLSTLGFGVIELCDLNYKNRRPVIAEAQMFGDSKFKRLQITAGPNKGTRMPYTITYLKDNELTWWCLGVESEVKDLLRYIMYLGKYRQAGFGPVRSWKVSPCSTQDFDVFPIIRDGLPMRPLPQDYPGLDAPSLDYRILDPLKHPTWAKRWEQPCAVPDFTLRE